jgi:hypothetical protein
MDVMLGHVFRVEDGLVGRFDIRGGSRGGGGEDQARFGVRVAMFFRVRRASLTASESGKVSSRSGAIRTTLVPSCMRA